MHKQLFIFHVEVCVLYSYKYNITTTQHNTSTTLITERVV